MPDWYARPVLHVAGVQASISFYRDRLGFSEGWRPDLRARIKLMPPNSTARVSKP